MDKVFIYWDNSNIYISAQAVVDEREGFELRNRVRIHFENLYQLALAGREMARDFRMAPVSMLI